MRRGTVGGKQLVIGLPVDLLCMITTTCIIMRAGGRYNLEENGRNGNAELTFNKQ